MPLLERDRRNGDAAGIIETGEMALGDESK